MFGGSFSINMVLLPELPRTLIATAPARNHILALPLALGYTQVVMAPRLLAAKMPRGRRMSQRRSLWSTGSRMLAGGGEGLRVTRRSLRAVKNRQSYVNPM